MWGFQGGLAHLRPSLSPPGRLCRLRGCSAAPSGLPHGWAVLRKGGVEVRIPRWLSVIVCVVMLASSGGAASALEINDATRAQLEQLNGLGVAMTERVIVERAKAPFQSWDELRTRVKGIGLKRARQLDAQGLTVNGAPLPPGQGTPR